MTGDISVVGGDQNTDIEFKNCSVFTRCTTHLNDERIETAENLDIVRNMYNLIEYSDNYSEKSGSIWQYKRDEQNMNNNNIANVTTADSSSFKYKSGLLKGLTSTAINVGDNPNVPQAHRLFTNAQILLPLSYVSSFLRSLEMPLINCKIHLELTCNKNCIMSSVVGPASFQIKNTKLYVLVVTLKTKDHVNLMKPLEKGFKRSVYWNEYKSKIVTQEADNNNLKRYLLDSSFQGVNRLFVLAFDDTNQPNKVERNDSKKYFMPRVDIKKYNDLIDGRNFYDQPVSDQTRKHNDVRKITTGKGDDFTTGCLLDYDYFLKHYQLVAINLSKQKELHADPRSNQQIEFSCILDTNSQVCTVLEKSKETILEFYKGTAKVL